MHPLTAVLFALCGLGLWAATRPEPLGPGEAPRLRRTCGFAVLTAGALSLLDVFGLPVSIERVLSLSTGTTDPVLLRGIGALTALNFLFCGLGLVLLDRQTKGGTRPAQTFIVAAGTLSLMAMIAYSYKFLTPYRTGSSAPVALLTAFSFVLWCAAALAARPEQGAITLINAPTTGGTMVRRLLPTAILIPWLLGAFRWMGETAGFYDTEFGVALFAATIILIFAGLIWWNATLLHKADLERRQAEERLRQATLNLERSNRELQQFAYVASHDLFEPLRMVTSYLQLLQDVQKEKLDARSLEFISFAIDGARRMRALIEDLLAYSRVEARGAAFAEVDCEQVVRAAVTNLKVAIEESGAIVNVGSLPRVRGDAVQLTQVFQNLIGNAVKFRGQNPTRIEVAADRQGQEWIIHVRDNGIGIPAGEFERIFVIFQRLHTRREYPGTGMGLAICKKIVERHGGRIWVESEVGKGTTFLVALPALG